MTFIQQAWQWAIQHPEISIMVAFSLLTLVRRRHTSIVQWVRKNPRRAGLLKVLQAVFPDPLKLLDGVLLVLTGKMSASKAKRIEAIINAILGPAIVLALLGCQPTLPTQPVQAPVITTTAVPVNAQETIRLAKMGLNATDVALATAISALPDGADIKPWESRVILLESSRVVLEQTDVTVREVCRELPPLTDLARGLGCPTCASLMDAARVAGCGGAL